MTKTGCIIQGNIRQGIKLVVDEMARHFDHIVFSTWEEEKSKVPAGRFELVLNKRPINNGITNRNLQRLSTIEGFKCIESLGCDYVMKWRSDMLPTALDCNELIQYVNYRVPKGVPSRIFMSAFRNLSVEPDWFSSFSDIYAFGHIEMMRLLWAHGEFDFSKNFNIPKDMLNQQGLEYKDGRLLLDGVNVTLDYDAHIEHYAFFKDGLQKYMRRQINHPEIARDYLYLADHKRIKICWFRSNEKNKLRSIGQAWYIPWLTEKIWFNSKLPEPISLWNKKALKAHFWQNFYRAIRVQQEIWMGKYWLNRYRNIIGKKST